MKKLMIIAAVAMAAFASDAAQYVWKTKTAGKIYNASDSSYSGTAYIFADAGETTRAKIFNLLAANQADDAIELALDFNSISDGSISSKQPSDAFTYGGDITAYVIVVEDGRFFIGGDTFQTQTSVGAGTVNLDNNRDGSKLAALDKSAGLQSGARWYTAVPEPTSGLLLLLGVAGLALKRRRA